ncbi:hypothetical protein AALP_AA2G039500 [Arabis alpina]|uniref:Uncharacterized protein n=1 Tax=Arabis alpina TaxID=50452 RepID=A0A087HF75_ARAAL|nr:hypothetical protein AALP_AA2G039500 [Arabis alpina]
MGRHAFKQTLDEIVKDKSDDTLGTLVGRLKQSSIALHGFPLAIQLVAFETIYGLDLIHVEPGEELRRRAIAGDDIIVCEQSEELIVEPILSTAEEYDEELLKWDDDVDDPKIQLVESLINSGHVFTKEEWPGGDFTCPHVLSPYEKAVIKDYEVSLERRKKAADLLKRKRGVEDVVTVKSDDFQDPPKQTRTRAATAGRRTGAVVAAVQQDMTIADAIIKMQEFFRSEFNKLALAQQPTKPRVKKSIPKRPPISLSHSPSGDISVSTSGKAGEAAFAAEMEENRMFEDYDGVASVLRSVKDVEGDMDDNKGNETDIENDAYGNDISGVERVYGGGAADGREKVVAVKDMEIKDVHSDAAGDELHTFTTGTTDVVLLYTVCQ